VVAAGEQHAVAAAAVEPAHPQQLDRAPLPRAAQLANLQVRALLVARDKLAQVCL
jgi:hypothetical protein